MLKKKIADSGRLFVDFRNLGIVAKIRKSRKSGLASLPPPKCDVRED